MLTQFHRIFTVLAVASLALYVPALAAPARGQDLIAQGDKLFAAKDFKNAQKQFRDAATELEGSTNREREHDSILFKTYCKLIQCAYAVKDYREAAAVYSKVLPCIARLKGRDSVDYVESMCNYSTLLDQLGRFDEADAWARTAIRRVKLNLRDDPAAQALLPRATKCHQVASDHIAAAKLGRATLSPATAERPLRSHRTDSGTHD